MARNSEMILRQGLNHPGPLTLGLVFGGGLLTSLGPCSLSLMPVTIAYLAGFEQKHPQSPFIRSVSFCGGIVLALVLLGSISGLLGGIYGQVPKVIPTLVALLALIMGANLLGLITIPIPSGPNPKSFEKRVPAQLAPMAAGLAFGLAASPCSTPVLAVLLGWIAQNGKVLSGVVLLTSFGIGQVLVLLIAGTFAASIPKILLLKPVASLIPPISGIILLMTGMLSLLANWV